MSTFRTLLVCGLGLFYLNVQVAHAEEWLEYLYSKGFCFRGSNAEAVKFYDRCEYGMQLRHDRYAPVLYGRKKSHGKERCYALDTRTSDGTILRFKTNSSKCLQADQPLPLQAPAPIDHMGIEHHKKKLQALIEKQRFALNYILGYLPDRTPERHLGNSAYDPLCNAFIDHRMRLENPDLVYSYVQLLRADLTEKERKALIDWMDLYLSHYAKLQEYCVWKKVPHDKAKVYALIAAKMDRSLASLDRYLKKNKFRPTKLDSKASVKRKKTLTGFETCPK